MASRAIDFHGNDITTNRQTLPCFD
jgi:hypothetical protein